MYSLSPFPRRPKAVKRRLEISEHDEGFSLARAAGGPKKQKLMVESAPDVNRESEQSRSGGSNGVGGTPSPKRSEDVTRAPMAALDGATPLDAIHTAALDATFDAISKSVMVAGGLDDLLAGTGPYSPGRLTIPRPQKTSTGNATSAAGATNGSMRLTSAQVITPPLRSTTTSPWSSEPAKTPESSTKTSPQRPRTRIQWSVEMWDEVLQAIREVGPEGFKAKEVSAIISANKDGAIAVAFRGAGQTKRTAAVRCRLRQITGGNLRQWHPFTRWKGFTKRMLFFGKSFHLRNSLFKVAYEMGFNVDLGEGLGADGKAISAVNTIVKPEAYYITAPPSSDDDMDGSSGSDGGSMDSDGDGCERTVWT